MAGNGAGIDFRPWCDTDSIVELTELLHRGYAALATAGLRFVASWQPPETTRSRLADGECWLALRQGTMVGTICVYPPRASSISWYARPDVATFGQFTVSPDLRGQGLGGALLEKVEQRAIDIGVSELACDTAEPAKELLAFYQARGFRVVGSTQHLETNYRSIILSKSLRAHVT